VARAVEAHEVSGVVNIATGRETTVNDLYRRLARAIEVARAPEHGPARPGEQRRSVLDATRAKAMLQWTATTSLDEGLMKTIAWFRKELQS
jgi:UDP-glucose 4-epimerase